MLLKINKYRTLRMHPKKILIHNITRPRPDFKTIELSPPYLLLALLNYSNLLKRTKTSYARLKLYCKRIKINFTAAKAAKFHTCLALLLNHLKLWAVTKSECDFVMHFVNMTNHENI